MLVPATICSLIGGALAIARLTGDWSDDTADTDQSDTDSTDQTEDQE